MTGIVLDRHTVVEFLNRFEAIAEKENFDLIEDMVHADAVFRFNDGDFVVVANGRLQIIHEPLSRCPRPGP